MQTLISTVERYRHSYSSSADLITGSDARRAYGLPGNIVSRSLDEILKPLKDLVSVLKMDAR